MGALHWSLSSRPYESVKRAPAPPSSLKHVAHKSHGSFSQLLLGTIGYKLFEKASRAGTVILAKYLFLRSARQNFSTTNNPCRLIFSGSLPVVSEPGRLVSKRHSRPVFKLIYSLFTLIYSFIAKLKFSERQHVNRRVVAQG